jgi:hypothetical protein
MRNVLTQIARIEYCSKQTAKQHSNVMTERCNIVRKGTSGLTVMNKLLQQGKEDLLM